MYLQWLKCLSFLKEAFNVQQGIVMFPCLLPSLKADDKITLKTTTNGNTLSPKQK